MIYDLHLNRRMRTAAHQPRAAQFRRTALHTFYKKCARGGCAAVSRAYVTKVLQGNEVNFSFATPLLGHRLWRLAQGLEAGFAALRAYPPSFALRCISLGGYSLRFANALQMDFTPQLTIKPDEDLEESEPTAILHPSSFTLHSPTPNLSTPAFAMA